MPCSAVIAMTTSLPAAMQMWSWATTVKSSMKTRGAELEVIRSLTPTLGDDDMIHSGDGDDLVLGGLNSDTIRAGEGNNVVLGDHGLINFINADGNRADIDLIVSLYPDYGGNDDILTGAGDDIIIGGDDGEIVVDATGANPNPARVVEADDEDGDLIAAGNGTNLVFGDNGQVIAADSNDDRFGNLPITLGVVETTDSLIGGSDSITTGIGRDIILGGIDADVITANAGEHQDGNGADANKPCDR